MAVRSTGPLLTTSPVIPIPVALLWRVRIDLRRKLALGTTLCLSIFLIVTAIVRVSGGNTVDGRVDSSWVIFWLQVEAAVAVMVVSVTAFRALFAAERSQRQESPRYTAKSRTKYWHETKDSEEARENRRLPSNLEPNLAGVQGVIHQVSYEDERSTRSGQQLHPSQGQRRDPSEVRLESSGDRLAQLITADALNQPDAIFI